MTKYTRKTFLFSDSIYDKLLQLKEKLGVKHETSIVEQAINHFYVENFETYTALVRNKTLKPKMTEEDRAERDAQRKIDAKSKKEELELEDQKRICEMLDGKIVDSCCHYNTHILYNDGDEEITAQKQGIGYLTESDCENQYSYLGKKFTKEQYYEKQAELKVLHENTLKNKAKAKK